MNTTSTKSVANRQNLISYHLLQLLLLSFGLAACAPPAPPPDIITPTLAPHPLIENAPLVTPVAPTISDISEPLWQTPLSDAVNVTPVVVGDLVIVATADGKIHAIKAATGTPAWSFEPDGGIWDASLRVGDDRVCIGLPERQVSCLDVVTGRPLWMAVLDLDMQSRPALDNDVLYVPTTHVGAKLDNNYEGQAILYALDASTGDILWQTTTENYILRRPIVVDNLVITGGAYRGEGDEPNRIYAFDKESGVEIWRHESEDGLIRWLATSGETVAFAGHSEIVRGLDLATGQLAWSFGPSYWMQFPAVADGQFFLGTGDERFHALESTTGKQLWEQSIDLDSLNQIGRPLLQDDLILFNAVTGDIYGLRQTDGVQVLHLETGITARVGGALYENLYIMGDAEGVLYAYAIR